ncbi:hypothetical protein ABPG74_006184 [Tetrahymena malaccensis]
MSKKEKKNKKNNNNININNSLLSSQQNILSQSRTEQNFIQCRFVDDYGEQGELIELDISQYLKQINQSLTAAVLTDFLFSNLHNIDETKIQISYDEQNYVYLNQLDQKVQLNFINNCIKLRLRRAQFSIFQRLLRLEEENKELKNKIQQMQIDKQNDLKISVMNSKNEEEEEIDDNLIDLAILYSDPLVEMKRTIQPYQQSVSYQKEIVDLKQELQSISKQIKIKIANLTIDNLQKVCMHNKPTILHIICHGQIDNKDKYLHFENSDYSLQKINPDDLRKILTHLEDKKPKLVFVNACNSAIVSDVFREAGIPFVVSVDQNHSILDEVAQKFSKHFYRYIIQQGKSIEDLFLNAQEITDKVIQGTKNYPCCCLHEHKSDCKWFNGDDQNPNHEDHILDCNCSQKQQQKHYNSCKEAKEFLQKYKPQSLEFPQQNFLFTCCCYTYQELQEKNLLYHKECQKFKLDYDPQDDFFNKPLFKSKKAGRLIDKSDFEIENISSTLFVRKVETFNVLKTLRDPNQKCISIIGKKRVGKSLFVTKLIEYSKLRGLYHDFVQEIDMKEIFYCEQIWPQFKKNSKKETLDYVQNLDGLIYFKDCDKIFEKDENNFKQLLQDLSRYTKQLKIILTIQKEYHSPFFTFYLKDYLAYDTRVYLNYLLLQENVTINKRKQYINDFLNNPKIQRTTYNIQYFAKYKHFSGIETIEDNQKQILEEIQQDPQLFKLCCILSFFKYGLNEQDFITLAQSNLIPADWLDQLQKIILKVDNRQTNFVAHKFQDLYEIVKGKTIGISRGRLKFFNITMREVFIEQGSKHFEPILISLYLFSSVLIKKERKTDWKLLKLIDFSIFSLNVEVFKDIIPKIKNPIIEAEDNQQQESQDRGQKVNWISDTSQYIFSLLDKHDLINDSMTSEEIEAIVQVVLALFFQLVSLMKLNITKNFLIKPICYWGQRFFQNYLQMVPEKKLSKEHQIKKAEIYLDLLLLDIGMNEKKGHEQIKQHFENINFILKKLEGMDFQQVIESQLYQCKAYLLILKDQYEYLSTGKLDLIEYQKDKEQILENLTKSDQCLSNDGYSENFVYKELNATIKHKNTILLQEQKILFEPHSLTSEDKAAVHTIQQKYIKNKCYKNICIIYETIMNHIQFQIYMNQMQNGKTEAFNNLNIHIEQKFPQFKDRENFYGSVRLQIYKLIIQRYREECNKGLIYVMHSQPLIDFKSEQNDSLGNSFGTQKSQKQQFDYLDQPYYSIWNYNEILRSQVFQKCKKQIKYSFLSFNRKNYNLATNSGCQIMSINSNFNEDSSLKTLQFEGSQLLEVDQYDNEQDRILEKIQQLQNVKILILCVNNGQALKNIMQENILEGQQQHQRVIIYFPFKETCKSFDKVLICQKFQLEFFKQYLNQNNKTIKESFDAAKEQTKNFILKKFDLKKVQNINFDKVFGDVPSIYSNPDSFLDQPFVIDEIDKPQEITPLIKQSNVLESINMDKVILKSRDIYYLKHFFNESDVRLVNLYNQSNISKTGKTTLALSFAMTMLERNLHFTGGIHFIQNKHSSLGSISSQKSMAINLKQTHSAGSNFNDSSQMNQSIQSHSSHCTTTFNSCHIQGGSSASLKQTLESLNDKLFKIKSSNFNNFNSNQSAYSQFNQYNYQTHADPVLIILSGFDCFSPKQFEFLFERNYLPNYKFLNISNRKFSLPQQIHSKMFKNHEVMSYKNILNRLLQIKIEEEEEESISTQKKSDNHHHHNNHHNHQSNKNKQKQSKYQKNQPSKHSNNNNNHHNQVMSSSALSLLDPCPKSVGQSQIQQQVSSIIPKTTPFLVSQKSQNKNSSKSFSSDNTTSNYQIYPLNLHDLNTVNSCDAFLLKGTVSEIQKEYRENDEFFDEIDNEMFKQVNRSISNSIQLTPFSQQSTKKSQTNLPSMGNKQIGDITNNGSLYEALDSNFEETDHMKAELFKEQNETFSEICESSNEDQINKYNKKNKDFFHSRENLNSSKTENQIRKPKYSSSQDQQNIKLCTSSYDDNNQCEENGEIYQDDSEKEDLDNDRTFD